MHENLKHTVKKHLTKKITKLFTLSDNCYQQQLTLYISYQTILTLSLNYSYGIIHTFPDIKRSHFQRVTCKQYYTLFQSLYQAILTF